MHLNNQYVECDYLIFILTPFKLCFQIKKLEKKKFFNQSFIKGEQQES